MHHRKCVTFSARYADGCIYAGDFVGGSRSGRGVQRYDAKIRQFPTNMQQCVTSMQQYVTNMQEYVTSTQVVGRRFLCGGVEGG